MAVKNLSENRAFLKDEPLCCCEFIDFRGNRSHILAACCDCEVLDDTCERLITRKSVPTENYNNLWMMCRDRLRVPCWGGSGAMKINPEVLFPIFLVPAMICLAACGPFWTVGAFTAIPLFCFYFHRRYLRHNPRTCFFVVWSLCTLIFLMGVMEVEVIPYMEIYVYEIVIHKTFIGAMLFCVFCLRRDPGMLDPKSTEIAASVGDPENVSRCNFCNTVQINRAGHCRICNCCIMLRDHHCIWIDCCIGSKNHRAFIFCLVFLIFGTYYGSMLTLTTVCEPILVENLLLIPHDCTGVYDSIHLGVCFVSALYALMIMAAALCALIHQLYLISINMTAQEWRASRTKGPNRSGHIYLQSKVGIENLLGKGLCHPWLQDKNRVHLHPIFCPQPQFLRIIELKSAKKSLFKAAIQMYNNISVLLVEY